MIFSRLTYRRAVNILMFVLCGLSALLVLLPLIMIFAYTISQGARAISWDFFTQLPRPVGEPGGGMANAIVGTLIVTGIGSLFGIPVGVGAGIFLSEYGRGRFAAFTRFCVDILSGIPSIIIGVFAWSVIVLPMKSFSALAGGAALGVLMIPTVTRTTEEMLRLVRRDYREASLALGISQRTTILRIVLRTALGGVVTGILLAVARVAGETAPLLFTALGNRFWSTAIKQPIAALSLQVYDYAKAPFDDWHAQAWAGALTLITMIFVLSVLVRLATRGRTSVS